jgi:hypothetical protein
VSAMAACLVVWAGGWGVDDRPTDTVWTGWGVGAMGGPGVFDVARAQRWAVLRAAVAGPPAPGGWRARALVSAVVAVCRSVVWGVFD